MSTHTSELQYHSRHGTIAMLVSLTCFTGNALLLKVLASIRHVDPWMSLTFRAGLGLLVTIVLFAPAGTLKLRRSFQSWLLASRGVLGRSARRLTIPPSARWVRGRPR